METRTPRLSGELVRTTTSFNLWKSYCGHNYLPSHLFTFCVQFYERVNDPWIGYDWSLHVVSKVVQSESTSWHNSPSAQSFRVMCSFWFIVPCYWAWSPLVEVRVHFLQVELFWRALFYETSIYKWMCNLDNSWISSATSQLTSSTI